MIIYLFVKPPVILVLSLYRLLIDLLQIMIAKLQYMPNLQTAIKRIFVVVLTIHGIAGIEIVYRNTTIWWGEGWKGGVSTYLFHCSGRQYPVHVSS